MPYVAEQRMVSKHERGAERSGLDRPLFERGWLSGRSPGGRSGSSSATARIGPGFLS